MVIFDKIHCSRDESIWRHIVILQNFMQKILAVANPLKFWAMKRHSRCYLYIVHKVYTAIHNIDACGVNLPLPGPPLPGPPLPLPPRPPRYAKFTLSCFSPYCYREYTNSYIILNVQSTDYPRYCSTHTYMHIYQSTILPREDNFVIICDSKRCSC